MFNISSPFASFVVIDCEVLVVVASAVFVCAFILLLNKFHMFMTLSSLETQTTHNSKWWFKSTESESYIFVKLGSRV